MNLPLRTGRASDWVYYLSLVCLAGGVGWGLVRGPDAVRLSVALATTSLALFVIAMMVTPRTVGGPGPKPLINFPEMNSGIAGLAALFLVLAAIQGFRALRADRATEGSERLSVTE